MSAYSGHYGTSLTQVGVTPLLAATTKGQRDVVKVLLKHGADPHVMDPETSRTALQEAIHQEHEEIKNMLVQAEAKAAEKVSSARVCVCVCVCTCK